MAGTRPASAHSLEDCEGLRVDDGEGAIGGVAAAPPAVPNIEVRRARPLLGTLVEIRAAPRTATCSQQAMARLHRAVDAAFDAIEVVQRLMSCHDPESDLSRLNRTAAGQAQRAHTYTYDVLSAAVRFARLGAGAFDPCVAERLEEWGYLPAATGSSKRRAAQAPRRPRARQAGAATWEDIELLGNQRVRFRRPLRLDLGGIAKGFAVDLATEVLRRAGVDEIVVNAGGDMRVAGMRTHRVYLRDPRAPMGTLNPIDLRNSALATSAPCFSRRVLKGRPVSALLDPRTREPYVVNNSISVRAGNCMTADALTKIVLFAPGSIAERALEECGAQACVLQGEG
jgi:FAD:protein FMN transferase